MVVVAAGERDATDDAVRPRVDDRDVVARLDVDEHAAGARVVLDVSGLAAERIVAMRCPPAFSTVSTPPLSSETNT